MSETWYKIGGRVLSFSSRPISFVVETIDGSDFTLTLENGESGTYASGGTSTILYSGANSHPNFSFSNPLNIKRFETSDAIYIDNSQMGWLNIERLRCEGNSRGDFTDIGLLTSLTYLNLNSNSFTGNMSVVSALTSLTYLYLQGNLFTGDMSVVIALTSLTYLRLGGISLTGNMSGVSALTSLTTLYLNGNSLTGDVSSVSSLTSLTVLYLIGNSLTGDMSGVKLLTSLTYLNLRSVSFTGDMSDVKLLTSLTTLWLESILLSGDISDAVQLPLLRTIALLGNYTIIYTSKTFASSYSDFYFSPTTAANSLSSTELDQLLIDASQTTWSDTKRLHASGNNGIRTSASDAAVATLQAMGVTLYLNV